MRIDAAELAFRGLNRQIQTAINSGEMTLELDNVCGQRYIAAGLAVRAEILVNGTPGNNIGCFMAGARVMVRGNVQDCAANTMSAGEIIVHGRAGDVLGYAMRGGRVFIRDDAGYRAGIHMKSYKDCEPVIIIGGCAGSYLGEYMAGGMLVVLGLDRHDNKPLAGDFMGTGAHGGEIFIRGAIDDRRLGREVGIVKLTDDNWNKLLPHLLAFAREFNVDHALLERDRFIRLSPISHRPYGAIYVQ